MIFLFLSFLLFSTAASAQQATKTDIQALEAKITNLETTVREMDKRLTVQIQAVQTTMAEMDKRLTAQIQATQATIVEMDKRLTAQIQATQATIAEMDKRMNIQTKILFWAISTLIGVVLAVIALPQLLGYFREKRARVDFQEQVNELKQRIEQQQQEIETLKSQRIVTHSQS